MPEYTTTEAAALLQTARRNVQNYARRHGLPKFGREYVITEVDIEGLKRELGKPGPKPKPRGEDGRAAPRSPSAGARPTEERQRPR